MDLPFFLELTSIKADSSLSVIVEYPETNMAAYFELVYLHDL